MDQAPNNIPEKTAWLRRLEQESWQSELIISGIAIFGSLQLPDLIDVLADWSIGFFSTQIYRFIYAFFIYLYIGAAILTLSFVMHFILRAMWVGLVGLNSVFPEGINTQSPSYPAVFLERIKQEFPSNNEHNIHRLDDFCSSIFSVCTLTVMVFLAIGMDVIVMLIINQLFSYILSPSAVEMVMACIIGFLLVATVFQSSLKLKWVQRHPVFGQWHYPVQRFFSRLLMHIFYRPVTRLSYTFVTNVKWSSYVVGITIFFIVIMVFGGLLLARSPAIYLSSAGLIADKYARSDRYYPDNYENQRQAGQGRIHSALIPTEIIKDPFLKVFVPILGNESSRTDSICGVWSSDDSLSEEENTDRRRQFTLDCYQRYHRFYINDSLYQIAVRVYRHPNQDELGVQGFLPIGHLPPGEHILKVEKISPGNTPKPARTMYVPFVKGY